MSKGVNAHLRYMTECTSVYIDCVMENGASEPFCFLAEDDYLLLTEGGSTLFHVTGKGGKYTLPCDRQEYMCVLPFDEGLSNGSLNTHFYR